MSQCNLSAVSQTCSCCPTAISTMFVTERGSSSLCVTDRNGRILIVAVSESLTHSVIHSLSFIHKYVLLRSSIPLWLTVHLASHLFSPFSCPHTHSLLADRQLRLLSSAGAEPLLQITSSRTWFSDGLNVGALPSHFSIMTFDDLLIQIVTATFLQNQNCVQTP